MRTPEIKTMTGEEVIALLRSLGAIEAGHFVLSSGRHSDVYVEKFRALERPEAAHRLGRAIADRFRDRRIDVVLSPALGAIILGFSTALALGVRFVFGEREGQTMRLRRGFRIGAGERVLAVEDVVTTGRSLLEVLDLVPPGELAGIACLLDRSSPDQVRLPMTLD
ncbi:MAG: phosphoribosyltransferase family protein, partial [Actinomycetota bacterium]